jgi:hypothetical protein
MVPDSDKEDVELSFHLRDLPGCILGRISAEKDVVAVFLLVPSHRASIPLESWIGVLGRALPAGIFRKFRAKLRETIPGQRGHLVLCYLPNKIPEPELLSFRADQFLWIRGAIKWAEKRDGIRQQRPAETVA